MQLVAYGAQDVYLTANPKMSFFRNTYSKYTNYASEYIHQNFQGSVSFGGTAQCTISRNADLINKMYLVATINQTIGGTSVPWRNIKNLGNHLVKSIEVTIGGQRIDKHYGHWMDILSELEHEPELMNEMLGNNADHHSSGMKSTTTGSTKRSDAENDDIEVCVPLRFWFNRHSEAALPLIALQYHDVQFNVEFTESARLYQALKSSLTDHTNTVVISNASLLTEYIYLDSAERKWFAQNPHEILIEQMNWTQQSVVASTSAKTEKVNLTFNHPVAALYWQAQNENSITLSQNEHGFNLQDIANNMAMLHVWPAVSAALNTASIAMVPGDELLLFVNDDYTVGVLHDPIDIDGTIFMTETAVTDLDISASAHHKRAAAKWLQSLHFEIKVASDATALLSDLTAFLHHSRITSDPFPSILMSNDLRAAYNSSSAPRNFWKKVLPTSAADNSDGGVYGVEPSNRGKYADGSGNIVGKSQLLINGSERNCLLTRMQATAMMARQVGDVYVPGLFSQQFGKRPFSSVDPSGSCNMSRIDTSALSLELEHNIPACRISVYAVNYNVLRITSGMGGLAYSN